MPSSSRVPATAIGKHVVPAVAHPLAAAGAIGCPVQHHGRTYFAFAAAAPCALPRSDCGDRGGAPGNPTQAPRRSGPGVQPRARGRDQAHTGEDGGAARRNVGMTQRRGWGTTVGAKREAGCPPVRRGGRGAQSRKRKQKRGAREIHSYMSGANADRTKVEAHKRRVTPPLIGRQTPRPPPPPCPPLPPPTPWPAPAPSRPCRRPCRRPPPPLRPPTPWH